MFYWNECLSLFWLAHISCAFLCSKTGPRKYQCHYMTCSSRIRHALSGISIGSPKIAIVRHIHWVAIKIPFLSLLEKKRFLLLLQQISPLFWRKRQSTQNSSCCFPLVSPMGFFHFTAKNWLKWLGCWARMQTLTIHYIVIFKYSLCVCTYIAWRPFHHIISLYYASSCGRNWHEISPLEVVWTTVTVQTRLWTKKVASWEWLQWKL